MARKKRTPEERARDREEGERLHRKLAERIAYNERLIEADRERTERRRRLFRRVTFGLAGR